MVSGKGTSSKFHLVSFFDRASTISLEMSAGYLLTAEQQAKQAAVSVLSTFATEVSESRSTIASPILSLLLAPDASITISIVDRTSHQYRRKGLADIVAALADVGILGSTFTLELLYSDYFPSRVHCRSVGSFLPSDEGVGNNVRYSRTTGMCFKNGRWMIADDWIVLFP